jgi:hypothetical protein
VREEGDLRGKEDIQLLVSSALLSLVVELEFLVSRTLKLDLVVLEEPTLFLLTEEIAIEQEYSQVLEEF